MQTNAKRLAVNQLDQTLAQFKGIANTPVPKKGWIRAIRNALGMSAKQLGKRTNISQAAVAQIETSEAESKATIATMKKMAHALDCKFVYAIVPNTDLNDFIKRQAMLVAKRQLQQTAHSMSLESQSILDAETQQQVEMLVDNILINRPRYMWDEDGS